MSSLCLRGTVSLLFMLFACWISAAKSNPHLFPGFQQGSFAPAYLLFDFANLALHLAAPFELAVTFLPDRLHPGTESPAAAQGLAAVQSVGCGVAGTAAGSFRPKFGFFHAETRGIFEVYQVDFFGRLASAYGRH